MRTRWRGTATAAAVASVLAVSGCAGTVPMQPAEDAANPLCAEISVRLPDEIDGNAVRETDAQATAAWGTPAVVLLTCGVAVPAPSTLRCVTISGVDWLVDDTDPDLGVFTTYGRDPAVQVAVDHDVSDSGALYALSGAVSTNPATGACTTPDDVLGTG